MKGTESIKSKQRFRASLITLILVVIFYFLMRALITNGTINVYYVRILNLVCINIIAVVSLNIVTGFLGQLVLGHAGFMLIGAYFSAILTKTLGWNLHYSLILGMVGGGILAAFVGLIIGLPALRLKGDYLAIVTLGFGEILRVVANNLKITGGALGYSRYPVFEINKEPASFFTYTFFTAVFVIFFSYTLGTSRHGRAIISIREDEIAAESSGINTTRYKLLAFMLSAFFAGVGGALLAHQLGSIDASKFGFTKSVDYLMMSVLGGLGSITGSALSATALTIFPEVLRFMKDWRTLIYSILLILVMLFRPSGLLGRREVRVLPLYKKIFPFFFSSKKKSSSKNDEENTDKGGSE